MIRLLGALGLFLALSGAAWAQQAGPSNFVISQSCPRTGALYTSSQAGSPGNAAIDLNGNVCVSNNTGSASSPQTIAPTQGATANHVQPADVSCGATTVCTLSSATSRRFLSVHNTSATGYCRVAYAGITPAANRGDPLGPAAAAGGQGGNRTFETTYVPQGTVQAFCSVASTLAVMEAN